MVCMITQSAARTESPIQYNTVVLFEKLLVLNWCAFFTQCYLGGEFSPVGT